MRNLSSNDDPLIRDITVDVSFINHGLIISPLILWRKRIQLSSN